MQSLSIDSLLPHIVASLRDTPRLVIEAPPGAGKTTRIPPGLLDAGLAGEGEILILEPRRMAARLAARQVAKERGERLGESIGYAVRFESAGGPQTRLRYVTEGVLLRRLLSDSQLSQVGIVILDEFHERHLEADLALALLKRLQRESRPRLRLVAMSATLNAEPLARFLGDCPSLRSEGRRFDVAVEHLQRPDERPLAAQVEGAVRRLLREGLDGDVLVFLPGAAEIRRAREACASLAAEFDLLVLPLHGELPLAEQERAVGPAEKRKVILSTNVAESSVTIEGVTAVVDAGLARVAEHSPWSGLEAFKVARVSRASAVQRAGRAGRTRPGGRALRLYTAQDFAARPEYETPEILRSDLAETVLELRAAGIADDLEHFEWFEAPPRHALDQAESLLRRLDALDGESRVTALGRRMLHLPLHPRLARVALEAEARGVGRAGCLVAALISERDIRARQVLTDARGRTASRVTVHSNSDLLELLDLFTEAGQSGFAPRSLERLNLDPQSVHRVERVRRQLERLIRYGQKATAAMPLPTDEETELLLSILTGYPDRVARRRSSAVATRSDNLELALAGGGSAMLAPESVVREAEFLVAVDAEEHRGARKDTARGGAKTIVRLASAIEPGWLLDLFTKQVGETIAFEWDAEHERVETVRRLVYEEITLDESRANAKGFKAAGEVLAAAALAVGEEVFIEGEEVERLLARVDFVRREFPEAGFPSPGKDDVRGAVAALCEGRSSFAELRAAIRAGGLLEVLRRRLSREQARLLATAAPERITLAGGRRQVRVHYERGQPPWIASQLQDFFGLRVGPTVADGRRPLVLHLLAPNHRAVQVTTDLSGFWSRHYPQIRRELCRRYPRHAWPKDPLAPAASEKGTGQKK